MRSARGHNYRNAGYDGRKLGEANFCSLCDFANFYGITFWARIFEAQPGFTVATISKFGLRTATYKNIRHNAGHCEAISKQAAVIRALRF